MYTMDDVQKENAFYCNNLKETAIKWTQDIGLEIVPIGKNKRPLINWKTQRLRDASQIEAYLEADGNRCTGIAPVMANGIVCIDIDMHGADGFESIEQWQQEHGQFNETYTETTQSGGKHFFYRANTDGKRHTRTLDGVDVLSNGYIIVAPSRGEKGQYKAQGALEIANANQSVQELIDYAQSQNGQVQTNTDGVQALDIPVGQRVDFFTSQIGKMKDGTFDDETIKVTIREQNSKIANPLTDTELEKQVFPSLKNFVNHAPKKVDVPLTDKDISAMVVSMAEIEEKETEWLVHGWIPKGAITLLGGDGGLGKGLIWCNIVANLSNGMPCILENQTREQDEPKRTLILSAEDDESRTIVKRLKACKANLNNIDIVPMKDERFNSINFDNDILYQILSSKPYDLVIFDPLQSFIDANADMSKRNNMRKVLQPLLGYTEDTGLTALIVMHTNKRTGVSGRNRFADSADIYDIARSALLLGYTQEQGKRYIDHAKSNLGEMQKTILYAIHDGMAKYCGRTDKKDADFMAMRTKKNDTVKDEIKNTIIDVLNQSETKSLNSKDLKESVKKSVDFDLKDGTYQKAIADLKNVGRIKSNRIGLGQGKGMITIYNLNTSKPDVGTVLDWSSELN